MDFGAHILGFRSTHQYYKTAKYELHRTTGDGDTPGCIFHQLEQFKPIVFSKETLCYRLCMVIQWNPTKIQPDVSPSPVVRWSSYFAVLQYWWVLWNCRIWTPNSHSCSRYPLITPFSQWFSLSQYQCTAISFPEFGICLAAPPNIPRAPSVRLPSKFLYNFVPDPYFIGKTTRSPFI